MTNMVGPAPSNSSSAIANRPTLIEHDSYRFLIMDAPTDSNLLAYIEQLKRFDVGTVVRACEPTYSSVPLKQASIDVMELPFPDGAPPPTEVVNDWLDLVETTFRLTPTPKSSVDSSSKSAPKKATIAVHCVAGLGRAPVLVAIALIEKGMEPYDAIEFIRKKRRGAINARQLTYLENYRRRRKNGCVSCVIC